ncbi:MAG: hypothetical protein ACRD5J_16205, partial [Nitrososphaeraceae archaeon]
YRRVCKFNNKVVKAFHAGFDRIASKSSDHGSKKSLLLTTPTIFNGGVATATGRTKLGRIGGYE